MQISLCSEDNKKVSLVGALENFREEIKRKEVLYYKNSRITLAWALNFSWVFPRE